ncbi:MAG: single-stranded DNA-binding protein [Spirochaetaceae bacterium]|nr:single-stranded DNA-binding protein [Spirochaetaceae bacterium]
MNNLNVMILEGNCVREPELRETPKGTPVCNLSVATDRYYKIGENFEKEVSYFDVEVWGKMAIVASQNCPKGRGVRVSGRLKQGRWTGTDGSKHSKITIVADKMELKPLFNRSGEKIKKQLVVNGEAEETPVF